MIRTIQPHSAGAMSVNFDTGSAQAYLHANKYRIYMNRLFSTVYRIDKIYLEAGEKKTVTFVTDKDCFAYFNVCYNDWHADGGRYEILICRDAKRIEFKEKIKI